jgi:hypothetical protein
MALVKDITKKFESYPVLTHKDVKLYLEAEGKDTKNLPRFVNYMKKTGTLKGVRKGVHTFSNDASVIGFAYSPSYYGLLFALTIRDSWSQNSKPEIITIRDVKNSRKVGILDSDDVTYIHHISARLFFGYDIVKYGGPNVPASFPEKTLIDLLYYKVNLPLQNYDKILKVVDRKKVNKFLENYDVRLATRVLNFLSKYKPLADAGELTSPF